MYTKSSEATKNILAALTVVSQEPYLPDTPLLPANEHGLLAEWNATWQDYPRNACVPQLFAHQAAVTPHAIALVAGNQRLRYRELNLQANRLAHYLQRLGVGPDVLVGSYVERSPEMIVALLAILKAGGAYVPLDPAYPSERIAFMLNDAQISLLITKHHLTDHLDYKGRHIVCLDTDADLLSQQSTDEPAFTTQTNDLAYVIYTSGSTGQPKGVEITHGSLLNLVCWHQRAFSVTAADRVTQVTSPAFDATGWELWPYLTAGASVYLPDEDTRVTPTALRDWLVHQGITITFLPTVLAESVMALEWSSATQLRFLLTGADTLHHYPSHTLPFALVNNYGPTEGTVVTTSGQIVPTEHPDSPPSIGRPIDNVQTYILDQFLRPVPIGTPGELYIGGAGLARGYLNRPELTAERFILDPFSNEPGARLYKTGDLARFLPDGQIAFLGRTDHQIKIRGFRIEPDEIVARLNAHPDVKTSVVIAREDTPGEKRLVAYIIPFDSASLTVSSLRESLLAHLPDYMIPTAFVQLETLPITPNGKVDREALPAPDHTNTLRDREISEPRTPIEEKVAEIIAQLLETQQVGSDDNFFMLGGHSLLGTQVIARVTETFGIDLPLRTLFDAPTVRLLSSQIERLILLKLETMSEDEAALMLESDLKA